MTGVWVAEVGSYEDRYIAGVYLSAEAAMGDHPIPTGPRAKPCRPGGWQLDGESWWNGLDWGEAVTVEFYEIHEATR